MTQHAIERAKERYGIDLTARQCRQVDGWIRQYDPRIVFLSVRERFSNKYQKAWIYAVPIQGKWLAACWRYGEVITFYPASFIEQYSGILPPLKPAGNKAYNAL